MKRGGVVFVMLALAAMPAAASADDYGGGLLPAAAAPRHYTPTVGIALQTRGDRIALRFDTSIKCGSDSYDAVGRKVVPLRGDRFRARAASVFRIGGGTGNRVYFGWRLKGRAEGASASGRLTIKGVRILGSHRRACRQRPARRWTARLVAPAAAGAPIPAPRSAFDGLSDQVIADGLRGPVVLRLTNDASKVAARWTVSAHCGSGGPQHLINYTAPSLVRPDGTFANDERFAVAYADAYIRYRVTFSGRFSGDGATGTLQMRAGRYSRDGKPLRSRCDSGPRAWTAVRAPAAE